ncbi:Rpp14/Pop5-like protein [Elsinoe fawcettii]|nr:Rpp14/Pop5-like protein [Elsinoe fawcettii]
MVRIKHRYLLLHLLYPTPSSSSPRTSSSPPLALEFNAPTPDTLTPALLARLIRDTVSLLFGDHGAGMIASSLKVMYLSTPTSTAIVRVGRAHYRLVWAALTMVGRLPAPSTGGYGGDRGRGGRGGRGQGRDGREQGQEVVIRVVRISGTVKKCEEEVVRRGMEVIRRAKREGKEVGVGLGSLGMGEEGKGKGKDSMGIVDDDEDEDEGMDLDY